MNENGFCIKRGTNISHLFIDKILPIGDRNSYFGKNDIRYIKRFGLDHVRVPIHEEIMWLPDGHKNTDNFSLLDRVVRQSIDMGLRVILCLHELKAHRALGKKTPALFTDHKEVGNFCERWTEISHYFKTISNQYLAYELLNEPQAPNDEQWNQVTAHK